MELHELVAFQSNHLMAFKMHLTDVKDPQLHALYAETIHGIEQNLHELLRYYPQAPVGMRKSSDGDMTAFYAAHLLGFVKTAVRNYAIAITETATPQLRGTLQKQLNAAIALHGKAFQFMYDRGLYPAYDLERLLALDTKNAAKALEM
ncbi:spore coat protein [Paenibacillus thermotolerans]|uniref:spore coat protein n=1 Tax=Paenibacillus thermotolerans TaxID=3027807 RepID=UPI0023689385|nr:MULTISPECIES: spore coat protein [unclassified Paenibacillus]